MFKPPPGDGSREMIERVASLVGTRITAVRYQVSTLEYWLELLDGDFEAASEVARWDTYPHVGHFPYSVDLLLDDARRAYVSYSGRLEHFHVDIHFDSSWPEGEPDWLDVSDREPWRAVVGKPIRQATMIWAPVYVLCEDTPSVIYPQDIELVWDDGVRIRLSASEYDEAYGELRGHADAFAVIFSEAVAERFGFGPYAPTGPPDWDAVLKRTGLFGGGEE